MIPGYDHEETVSPGNVQHLNVDEPMGMVRLYTSVVRVYFEDGRSALYMKTELVEGPTIRYQYTPWRAVLDTVALVKNFSITALWDQQFADDVISEMEAEEGYSIIPSDQESISHVIRRTFNYFAKKDDFDYF